jgi:hypothetical protein
LATTAWRGRALVEDVAEVLLGGLLQLAALVDVRLQRPYDADVDHMLERALLALLGDVGAEVGVRRELLAHGSSYLIVIKSDAPSSR